jgi:hypothetical protein
LWHFTHSASPAAVRYRCRRADPHIQAPYDTQSYNRYSYVKNNPINYTDQIGYFFSGLGHWLKHNWKKAVAIVAAVAITVATGGGAAPA